MSSFPQSVILRDYQLELLDNIIDKETRPDLFPDNIVVQGFKSSGKSYCVREYFKTLDKDVNLRVFVSRHEIFSWKNLLTSIARNSYFELRKAYPHVQPTVEIDPVSAEDFYLLIEFFVTLFQAYDGELKSAKSFYVVLDNLDALPQIDFLVFARLVKAHESIPSDLKLRLKFLFTIESISFYDKYRTYDLPLIIFPRYTQDELQSILEFHVEQLSDSRALDQVCDRIGCQIDRDTLAKNYIKIIVESFYAYTGSDVESLQDMAILKWPKFLKTVTSANHNNTPELYKLNLKLWTHTNDSIDEDVEEMDNEEGPQQKKGKKSTDLSERYTLSNLTKYILISAYLGSYLDARFDAKNFSKKVYLRQGRSAYGSRIKQKLHPETMKPNSLSVERLLAILQAIFTIDRRNEEFVDEDEDGKKFKGEYFNYMDAMRSNIDVYENFAELISLKLILPSKTQYPDFLDSRVKWRANIPWEVMVQIADSVDFDIKEYFELQ